jgi:hypothetical protein
VAHGHLASAALTCVGKRLSHKYGFGSHADGPNPLEDPIFGNLGLDAAFLEELDGRAPGLFEVARYITA